MADSLSPMEGSCQSIKTEGSSDNQNTDNQNTDNQNVDIQNNDNQDGLPKEISNVQSDVDKYMQKWRENYKTNYAPRVESINSYLRSEKVEDKKMGYVKTMGLYMEIITGIALDIIDLNLNAKPFSNTEQPNNNVNNQDQ